MAQAIVWRRRAAFFVECQYSFDQAIFFMIIEINNGYQGRDQAFPAQQDRKAKHAIDLIVTVPGERKMGKATLVFLGLIVVVSYISFCI